AGRWPVTGRQALGCSSAQVPAAGEGALAPVQETHARGAGKSTRGRRAALLQRAHGALREAGIHCLPQATTSLEVGGLCQATIRWARARLRYMARYTHRVAISNRRLVSADDSGVAFRWKDYPLDGPDPSKTMTLHPPTS